jgi:sugar lactone lactonase YvrE
MIGRTKSGRLMDLNPTLVGVSIMWLLLSASPVQAQGVIATIAGNGSPAFAGDGGPATAAALNHPFGLAIDSTGGIYIADTDNARIRRVSPDGMISTVAGNGVPGASGDGGSALEASLSDVAGVALDAAGNFYFGDPSNRRVRKVTPAGIISTVVGTGVQGSSGDGGPATNATLNRPTFVVLDPAGNLYIADTSNQRIRRVDVHGTITTIAGNGLAGFSGDGGPATDASLMFPLGMAMDSIGNLYVADANNHRIRRINLSGVITTVAGNGVEGYSGDLGPATSASLNYPEDVAFDRAGNLFIADSGNNRIRKVDPSGVISTVAGTVLNGFSGDGGPSVEAVLNFPWGLATDAAGDVYIADRANSRIRKISPSRIVSHLANGQGWKTTILLVNADTHTASFTLSFWADNGSPLVLPLGKDGTAASVAGTIAPGQLRVIESSGLGGAIVEGWAELMTSDAIGGIGIFTASATNQPPSEAAAPLNSVGGTQLFIPFDNTSGGLVLSTGIALANPNQQAAVVGVTFTDQSGQNIPVKTSQITVPANGHYASVLSTDFPEVNGKRGTIKFNSNVDIYGLGIRYNGKAFTSIGALSSVPRGAKCISHLVNGQGWKTTILLVNTDTHTASFTLNFWADDGSPLVLLLKEDGMTASVSGTIAPGQLRVIESSGGGGTIVEGWAELMTSDAIGGIGIFTASATNQPPSEAAAPLDSVGGTQLFIPFDNTSGILAFSTGIALANPNQQAAVVGVTFTDQSGQNIPVKTSQITVPANGHYASVLSTVFPEVNGKRGTIQFNSNVDIYGLGIRYNGKAFTSIGAIIPGLN